MKSNATVLELAKAFLEIAETTPIERITISEIVSYCSRNRKTFYYYFVDIPDLVLWIFRNDLGNLLRAHFDEKHLVYESSPRKHFAELPFYVRVKSGVRTLNHAEFFELFARAFNAHALFYIKYFKHTNSHGALAFTQSLYLLYESAFREDIKFILGNRYLRQYETDLVAEFYANAFIHDVIRRVLSSRNEFLLKDIRCFGNFIHNAMTQEIEAQCLARQL